MINGMARDHRNRSYDAGKKCEQLPNFSDNLTVPTNSGDTNASMYSNNISNRNNTENLL